MQSAEIIRDLQSAPMLATLRAVDSRSKDCGNDEVLLQRAKMLAISRAVDSRSKDCGNDDFYFIINYLACHPGNFVVVK
jgi:hypothetical protein